MEHKVITVNTVERTQFMDITAEAEAFVSESGARDGVLHIYSRHTTAGIVINENESRLLRDMEGMLDKLIPRGAGYEHDRIDDNAHSHLRALLCGESKSVPIVDGKLQLGTWQRIFLVEFDGPRRREVLLVTA
ncbi:MAG: secondary thiamine-phosphate synthase enzyme YjbQ [Candidatus Hydrothermarchaeaceae archaeon]